MNKRENAKDVLNLRTIIGTMTGQYLADQYLPGLQSNNPDRMCSLTLPPPLPVSLARPCTSPAASNMVMTVLSVEPRLSYPGLGCSPVRSAVCSALLS